MQTHIEQVSFRLPKTILEQMRVIKKDFGVPLSEQLRRGLEMWLVSYPSRLEGQRAIRKKRHANAIRERRAGKDAQARTGR